MGFEGTPANVLPGLTRWPLVNRSWISLLELSRWPLRCVCKVECKQQQQRRERHRHELELKYHVGACLGRFQLRFVSVVELVVAEVHSLDFGSIFLIILLLEIGLSPVILVIWPFGEKESSCNLIALYRPRIFLARGDVCAERKICHRSIYFNPPRNEPFIQNNQNIVTFQG